MVSSKGFWWIPTLTADKDDRGVSSSFWPKSDETAARRTGQPTVHGEQKIQLPLPIVITNRRTNKLSSYSVVFTAVNTENCKPNIHPKIVYGSRILFSLVDVILIRRLTRRYHNDPAPPSFAAVKSNGRHWTRGDFFTMGFRMGAKKKKTMMLRLALLLLAVAVVRGHVADHRYNKGDHVELWVNKVSSSWRWLYPKVVRVSLSAAPLSELGEEACAWLANAAAEETRAPDSAFRCSASLCLRVRGVETESHNSHLSD